MPEGRGGMTLDSATVEQAVHQNMQDEACIQIVVATDRQMGKAEDALRASVMLNCSPPWNIWWMRSGDKGWTVGKEGSDADWVIGRDPGHPYATEGWSTDFTCFRFAIPELMGFNGRAIYMDVDFIVLRDLREIWETKMTHPMMAPAQRTDIALIDCWEFSGKEWWPSIREMKRSGWNIQDYRRLLKENGALGGAPLNWESWDGKALGPETFTIHYTNMHTQPWKPYPQRFKYPEHPHAQALALWHQYYELAKNAEATIDKRAILEARYDTLAKTDLNISKHMSVLRTLASECRHVVELGTESGRATIALLLGCPGKVTSYDIEEHATVPSLVKLADGQLTFVQGDSREIDIPECDMLFIDADHTYESVRKELFRHGPKVSKYIALHDTVSAGDKDIECLANFKSRYTSGPGINPAIKEFLDQYRGWRKWRHYEEWPGLTILRRDQ